MKLSTSTRSSFPIKLLFLSLAVYASSFVFPAFTAIGNDGRETMYGFQAFVMGATAILGGGVLEWVIWLANPLFFLSILLRRNQRRNAVHFGWLATTIAISFLLWEKILISESGSTGPIEMKDTGYFLWVTGIAFWTIGITIENRSIRNRTER